MPHISPIPPSSLSLESALDAIRSHHLSPEALTQKLAHLCSINTYSYNRKGHLAFVESFLPLIISLGSSHQCHDVPPYTKNDEQAPVGPIITVSQRLDAPIQVIFSGHYDTVFPPESPFSHCSFSQEKIIGPGVSDMKGGLVAVQEALRLFESLPYKEKSRLGWTFVITPDEEVGSVSSRQYLRSLVENIRKKKAFGVVVEPNLASGAFISERPGSLTITCIARGKKAHAGRDFWSGKNALTALIEVLHRIDTKCIELIREEKSEERTTLNIAKLHGGEAANIVPDHAQATINIRSQSIEAIIALKETITGCIQESSREGVVFSLYVDSFRPPKPETSAHTQAQALFEQAAAFISEEPIRWEPSGGVSDGNILQWQGLACLDGMGVAGGGLHTEEEWCDTSSIPIRVRQLAALLVMAAASENESMVPPVLPACVPMNELFSDNTIRSSPS